MVVEGELDKLRKKECIFDVRVRGAVGWDPSLSVIMKSVHRPHFLVSDDPPPPDFYSCIDAELHKVESFTLKRVTLLRYEISGIEKAVGSIGLAPKEIERARGMADGVAGSPSSHSRSMSTSTSWDFTRYSRSTNKNSPLQGLQAVLHQQDAQPGLGEGGLL